MRARPPGLREINLQLVLRQVFDAPTPVSRADVATQTGLTRGTVSALVEELLALGLLEEGEPSRGGRTGRPSVPLRMASGTVGGLGLEINVDQLGARVVDLAGNQVAQNVVELDLRGADPLATAAQLADVARPVVASAARKGVEIVGAAVSVPGPIRSGSNVVMNAPNLRWRNVDLAALLGGSEVLRGLPLRVMNDADLAAESEAWLRRRLRDPRVTSTFIFLSGDVGIGGALVLDNEIYRGPNGWAMEIGHTCVDRNGPRCQCGATGCLETYAGKHAMLAAAGLDLDRPVTELRDAAAAGDARARAALEAGGAAVGRALANAVNLLDVHQVVLGGVLEPVASLLTPSILEVMRESVLSASWERIVVTPALAGTYASLTGAALSVVSALVRDPMPFLRGRPTETVPMRQRAVAKS